MQSFTTEQIINIGEQKGFVYSSFEFSLEGNYTSSDSLFNHRDVPHFNHLHKNLAGGYGNEGIYYGEVVSFIRYFKFLGFSFPILTLMKDDGENRVLETYSFFCFQFLKLNEEIDLPNNRCLSKITYYIGSKSKLALKIFTPFFKRMFTKSFNDFKNDDRPFLNRRGDLKKLGFAFNKDNTKKFRYDSTLNVKKQNCFFVNNKNSLKNSAIIDVANIKNKKILKINDIGIMGFQLFKDGNLIKIYPRVCPHEGGDLDIDNDVGIKFTTEDFIKKNCRMRCNIHNRLFDPIVSIDISKEKKEYKSSMYSFIFDNDKIHIKIREDIDFTKEIDWSI